MSSPATSYAMASIATGVALLIRLALDPFLEPGHLEYIIFFAAVVLVSWYSGVGPALLALGLGAVAAVYFILEPRSSFEISNPGDGTGLAVYLAIGVAALLGHSIYKTRQRLRTRAEWLGRLVEVTAQVTWTTDAKGQIIEDSPSWRAFTGQTYDQWKGRGWLDAIHADDRERAAKTWLEAVASKTVYQTEYRVRTKAGDYRWMSVRGAPLLEPDGRVWQWIGMNIDIQDRKQAEQALRESEERFRAAFHQSAIGMAQVDFNGRHVQVNERYCQITGYSREELLGHTFLDITHPDDRERNLRRLRQFFSEGEKAPPYEVEKRYIRKDGQAVWVHVTASFVRDDAGKPQYIIRAVRDITERKHYEQTLRESEERFRNLADTAPIYMAMADEAGNAVYFNKPWLQWAGRAMEDMLGLGWLCTLHPEDAPKFERDFKHAFHNRIPINEQYRFRRADGEYRWMLAVGAPRIAPDGRFVGYFGTYTDFHELKQAQEALQKSEERFRAIISQATVGVAQVDFTGCFTLVNPRYCQILGYSETELLTMRMLDITHPEDAPRNLEQFRALVDGGPNYVIEIRHLRKDGAAVWVSSSVTAIRDAEGQLQSVLAVSADVTERKRQEQALRFLVDLNTATQSLAEPDEIMAVTARLLGEHLGADRCAYAEVEPDENHLTVTGDYTRNVSSIVGKFSMTSFGVEALRLMRTNKSYVVDDVDNDPRIGAADLPAYRQTQIRAIICVPLHKAGRFVAGMAVHQCSPRHWLPDEIELVELVVGRCWESIERARTVRDLRESEQRQRFIMDSMPQKIFTARPDGSMEYFNPQWMAFTGLAFDEIKDWGWARIIHPDDVEKNVRAWRHAVDTGELFQFEQRFRRADGEYRWHMSRALPMRNAGGKIVMWIGSSTDTHDIKRAEEAAVRRSEQVHRLADVASRLNTTHDVASLMNVVTEEARNLLSANQSVASFTIDEDWEQAISAVSLSDKYAKWRMYDAKPDGSGIYSLVCRSNKPMRMTQAQLEAHPAWKGFVAEAARHPPIRGWLAAPLVGRNGHNIGLIQLSDKYEGEFTEDDEAILVQMAQMTSIAIENARLVEDLREASSRKDEFLATLAHELRNPLAPIRNMLEIMKRTDVNGEQLQQARDTMDRQLAHMVRLIDDLLDVSRVSRGKLELRREQVELAPVISHAVEANRGLMGSAGHELNIALPPEPIYLYADPVRLTQIFDNLLNNACKYTNPGGRIRVTAEYQGNDVIVKVKDTGIGIPPDKLGSIFEMFAQIDHSLERLQGGLGIGLTLVKRLVEMHGGTVTAHSGGPGKGTEFAIRLPVLKEKSQPGKSPLPVAKELRTQPHRVLVVDDNRDNAESLAMLLKMTGNETHLAYDGLEAVEAAERFRPDMILLDIGLPKLNGYEVCRRIRQQPRGKNIAIVAVSGWGQEQDRRKSKEAGFDHHLVKPVDLNSLMKLLTEQEIATAH